jgi:hypothetical protein
MDKTDGRYAGTGFFEMGVIFAPQGVYFSKNRLIPLNFSIKNPFFQKKLVFLFPKLYI